MRYYWYSRNISLTKSFTPKKCYVYPVAHISVNYSQHHGETESETAPAPLDPPLQLRPSCCVDLPQVVWHQPWRSHHCFPNYGFPMVFLHAPLVFCHGRQVEDCIFKVHRAVLDDQHHNAFLGKAIKHATEDGRNGAMRDLKKNMVIWCE